MSKIILPKAEWDLLLKQVKEITPEIFGNDGNVLNLMEGEWKNKGNGMHYYSCIDGTHLGKYPMLDLENGKIAVKYAASEFKDWSKVDLDNLRNNGIPMFAMNPMQLIKCKKSQKHT